MRDLGVGMDAEREGSQRIRIGTMDLRIGEIALTYDALLISRNLRFRQIPYLRVEGCTQPTSRHRPTT